MKPSRTQSAEPALPQPTAGRAIFSALCAVLIGIGLARFAYAPLVPALIVKGWFNPAEAGYLGAANFAGYLAGAAAANILARRVGITPAVRVMMLLASASFFACAFPLSFSWFFIWRFVSGFTGGVLMVLAASSVLPLVAPARRGFANGIIFSGVGIGIAVSGTVVPPLLRLGLQETWLAFGVVSLAITIAAWGGWPSPLPQAAVARPPETAKPRASREVTLVFIAYALVGVGLIPHMVFLVDYASRALNYSVEAASMYWVLFGIGALVGPLCAGWFGDRAGFRFAFAAVLVIEVFAVALPAVSGNPLVLGLSSFIVGAFVPGVVPLVLGRLHELIHADDARRKAWGRATMAFAAGQAGGGFLFSLIPQSGGGYTLFFMLGAAALAIALAVALKPSTTPVLCSEACK
jgi:predicted MFS family arabinose efflux permease